MPSCYASLRERLRSATRALHEELERDVGIEDRIRTKSGYISHLVQLWRLHAPVEDELRRVDFGPFGFAYPHPYRAALLEADLAALGISPAMLTGLPVQPSPPLPSIGAALGCLYVVEGSAKGARAILPDIKTALGFDADRGASFFAARGPETGRLWRAAMTALNQIPTWSPEGDRAVAAAIQTFGMFKVGLQARMEPSAEAPTRLHDSALRNQPIPAAPIERGGR